MNKKRCDLTELLRAAVIDNRVDTIEFILNHKESVLDINRLDKHKKTILMHAIFNNNLDIISRILYYPNTQINNMDATGKTALAYSILHGCSISVIKTLLYCGANPNIKSFKSHIPIMYCESHPEKYKIFKLLLKNGSMIYSCKMMENIISNADAKIIKCLLSAGVSVNSIKKYNKKQTIEKTNIYLLFETNRKNILSRVMCNDQIFIVLSYL
jgi:ankyrin repeat protein